MVILIMRGDRVMRKFGIYGGQHGALVGFIETDKTRPSVSSIRALTYATGPMVVERGMLPHPRTGKPVWHYTLKCTTYTLVMATEIVDD